MLTSIEKLFRILECKSSRIDKSNNRLINKSIRYFKGVVHKSIK